MIHVLFSTKNRAKDLRKEVRDELHPYLAVAAREKGGAALAVGGGLDQVHLLLDLKPSVALSDFVRGLKTTSSSWVRRRFNRHFAWQTGYAAFSVSKSPQARVVDYIEAQEEHHKRVDFSKASTSLFSRRTRSNSTMIVSGNREPRRGDVELARGDNPGSANATSFPRALSRGRR